MIAKTFAPEMGAKLFMIMAKHRCVPGGTRLEG